MNDETEITIRGIPNNGPAGSRPRRPIVHIIASDDLYGVRSFSFHPDDANEIIEAIRYAARMAHDGRLRKPIVLKSRHQ